MINLSCPIPSSINPLSPNGFDFSIQKLPEIKFWCQQVNLPGISLGTVELATPWSTVPIPGEMLTYDPLNIQFLVDDQMTNYKAIHNWLIGLGFPEDRQQYVDLLTRDNTGVTSELAKNYSDATLGIVGSNNVVFKTVQFIDVLPISLETIMFQSTNNDVTYIVGNATFRYNIYKFL